MPGNIRELQNVIERQVIVSVDNQLIFDGPLTPDSELTVTDQPLKIGGQPLTESQLKQQDKSRIIEALKQTKGKVSGPNGAADLLQVKPTTLASRIKKYQIAPRNYK